VSTIDSTTDGTIVATTITFIDLPVSNTQVAHAPSCVVVYAGPSAHTPYCSDSHLRGNRDIHPAHNPALRSTQDLIWHSILSIISGWGWTDRVT
jgi:hypothetical protein